MGECHYEELESEPCPICNSYEDELADAVDGPENYGKDAELIDEVRKATKEK